MEYDEMDAEFGILVDELKQEVGCIATFLRPEDLRNLINATKTTGPALDPDRYYVLAMNALETNDPAAAVGFLLMAMVSESIQDETESISAELDGYDPVHNKLFKR